MMPAVRLPVPARRAARGWCIARALAAALLTGAAVVPLQAQRPDDARPGEPATPRDSTRLLRTMHAAQERFERTRRGALPLETGRSGGTSCDWRIGRFCYWYDDTPKPPGLREAVSVVAGRRALLVRFDSAARRLPGDRWILEQRVRYALDADDTSRALDALRPCGVERWRCAALAGLAHHVGANHRASDSAFAVALAAMPREQRCDWEDIALLLEGEARRRHERARCEDRAALAARFWWLARPLLSSPANDLRSEWFARHTMALLLRDAASTHGSGWARDEEELLLRFGWSTWWTRSPQPGAGVAPSWSVVGHSRTPDFDFSADHRLLLDARVAAVPRDWNLQRRASGFRYAPAYAAAFWVVAHQLATFQRGDSALVVAAWDVSADTVLGVVPLRAALVLQAAPDSAPRIVRDSAARHGGTLALRTGWWPAMFSLEVVDSAHTRAARVRATLPLTPRTGGLQLSDVLLYRDTGAVQPMLESVLPLALVSDAITGRRVGMFWETYGLRAEGELVSVVMTLQRVDAPLLRRAAEALGLAGRATPLKVRWPDQPDVRTGIAARAVRGALLPRPRPVSAAPRDRGGRAARHQ